MPIIIGILLIPLIIAIIRKSDMIKTKKKDRILLNITLVLIAIIFIILCWIVRAKPFDFKEYYSTEYMFYTGEYILYSGLIFMFSPFMWIIAIHFFRMVFDLIRVKKNARIKRDEDYIYYRENLEKISPSIIMFTSTFDIDIKKIIASTILKLKLTGYIEEKDENLIYTNKDETGLLESEKMVLKLIRDNYFDKNNYRSIVEQEALNNKYIVKNHGGILFRIIKIIIAIIIPLVIYGLSVMLDDYVFENYHIWPEDDGHCYIKLKSKKEIEKLYKEVKNKNDYYSTEFVDIGVSYSYDIIRADKLKYSVVRKAFLLNMLTTVVIGFFVIFVLISLYMVIVQIKFFNKNYRRTIKGNVLLNKAYALRNYLKEYSLLKDRQEKELVIWEYYLVYAVALDVNEKIEDKIIEKYIKKNNF